MIDSMKTVDYEMSTNFNMGTIDLTMQSTWAYTTIVHYKGENHGEVIYYVDK